MRDAGLTVLAVDDEQSQLEDLARLLRSSPTVEAVECAFDGHDALVKATVQQYDVIFLDVRMPDLDGVELGRVLRRFAVSPELVYVSAYDTAAADAFELHALDYLRKPVSRRRVEEALVRVSAARHEQAAESPETAPVTPGTDGELIALASVRGGANRLVSRGEILYAQAHGDYVRIVTRDGRYLLRATLQELEQRWSQFGFERVHRQFLANLHRAVEVSPLLGGTAELRFTDQLKIPIARRHVGALLRRLGV
jgi:two-component system, LytTR family, response regulator LytT